MNQRPETKDESPQDVAESLRRGETVQNTTLRTLILTGTFEEKVFLKHVTIGRLRVEDAHFHQGFQLGGCTVKNLRVTNQAVIEGGLDLRGSKIKIGSISGKVCGDTRLEAVRVEKNLVFSSASLEGDVRFFNGILGGWLEAKGTTFKGKVDFRSLDVAEGINLQDCPFEGDVILRGTTIHKKLDFTGSSIQGALDLSKAKLHDFVYLEDLQQGPKQTFSFANAVADRIMVHPEQLEGRLASEQASSWGLAMHEYGLLKRVFQNLHRYEEEDWAFYRFKINQRRSKPRSWSRPWTRISQGLDWLLLDKGCGYGTDPYRAIRSALILMVFFAGLYAVGHSGFNKTHEVIESLDAGHWLNEILFAMVTSISVFTSGFGASPHTLASGWLLIPLLTEAMLGTLLWGLFIVAFSRKVIR